MGIGVTTHDAVHFPESVRLLFCRFCVVDISFHSAKRIEQAIEGMTTQTAKKRENI